jgi:hypothetical protein
LKPSSLVVLIAQLSKFTSDGLSNTQARNKKVKTADDRLNHSEQI